MKFYRVSEKNLRKYLTMAHRLRALEQGGVDNWEWYGESIGNYIADCSMIDEKPYEDIEEIVDKDLSQISLCNCKEEKPSDLFNTMM